MEPFTLPAPHDGKTYSLPHVVRRVPSPPPTEKGSERPVFVSLPRISIQKDWYNEEAVR